MHLWRLGGHLRGWSYSEFINIGSESVDPAVDEWINVCGYPWDKRVLIGDQMVVEETLGPPGP
jgi:hypothetical protein